MRFTKEEKLTTIAEGQKIGVKTVSAKYDISDETYRHWRYKAEGIKPRKHFSLKKKLRILEEGVRDGVYRTCAAHHIDPGTYYSWKRRIGFTSRLRPVDRIVSARKRNWRFLRKDPRMGFSGLAPPM
jgi:transposase-like protein